MNTNRASGRAARRNAATTTNSDIRTSFDWLYALWVVLEVAAGWLFFGAPLLVALASRGTRLRHSRSKQISLWVIAAIVSLFALAPFLVIWFGLSTTHIEEHRFIVG
ncbi:MAG: hypothetical protein P0Y60_13255 [Candidatus Microbacterium colombiense]|nr:MAG: hypothetical protein P0Y60_13255 [Microbacterium sp.]